MPSTITFTGLASGMKTDEWVEALVSIKKEKVTTLETKKTNLNTSQSMLSSIQSSFASLRTSIEKLTDSKYGGSFDIFAKTKASSSETSLLTVTSTANAAGGTYNVSVQQLASATTAQSAEGKLSLNGSELFSSIENVSTGAFSVYVNGEKKTITVGEESTVNDVLSQINGLEGVSAELKNGKVSIVADSGNSVVVGSSTDSVNAMKALSLTKDADGNYESIEVLSKFSKSSKIVDALGASAAGKFTVGEAEITIDENTTFESLIKLINEDKNSGVQASFDSAKGQMLLTSKNNGSFNINIEKGTSDFTDLMGFTSTDNGVTKLADQTLGKFAVFTINGETKMSSSNSVTSDISGIQGVTFSLKAVSTTEKASSTVSVSQDSADLMTAIKDFIEKYNSAIAKVDTETASEGALYGENNLISLRNNLRTTATAKDAGAATYSILASIGITTGAATKDVSKVSNKLELDEKKFAEALEKNPDAVKELLIGGKNNTGVLTKLENTVDQSLTSSGYFTTRHNSIDKQITNVQNLITSENTKISAYKTRLEKEFKNMETMIANFRKAYSSFIPTS